jgi:hypothetical protein
MIWSSISSIIWSKMRSASLHHMTRTPHAQITQRPRLRATLALVEVLLKGRESRERALAQRALIAMSHEGVVPDVIVPYLVGGVVAVPAATFGGHVTGAYPISVQRSFVKNSTTAAPRRVCDAMLATRPRAITPMTSGK